MRCVYVDPSDSWIICVNWYGRRGCFIQRAERVWVCGRSLAWRFDEALLVVRVMAAPRRLGTGNPAADGCVGRDIMFVVLVVVS